jgi:hypothetical protein
MPFIRGRYYANPIVGAALEAARDAEDAAVSQEDRDPERGEDSDSEGDAESRPIRRIEIELAELVPTHSGEGTKSYIASLHREAAADADGDDGHSAATEKHIFDDPGQVVNFLRETLAKNGSCR